MPRDAKIMSEALHRFQADKERRNARLERRTEEIYRRVPAVERIDRELRGTAARIVVEHSWHGPHWNFHNWY